MVALSVKGKQALDDLVARTVREQKIPGFVFGVSTVDETIYFNAGGTNVLNDPNSGNVNKDSVFWICSQTKLITHLAALMLIERGKLSFETIVADYLPGLRDPVILDDIMADNPTFKPAKNAIRVKHLLNMSAGLPYPPKGWKPDKQCSEYLAPHVGDPATEFLKLLQGDFPGVPLQFEPGTDFAYGFSSDILGFLVEKITGMTLERFFKENIFNPLGLKSASFYLTPDLKSKLVDLSYRRDGKLEPWADQVPVGERDPAKINRHFGGVTFYMSLNDYLTLLRHLLQIHGKYTSGKAANPIVSQETVRRLFEPNLNEAGVKSFKAIAALNPYSPKGGYSWSTALAVHTVNRPGGPKKGSAFWWGWAGTYHFIDPTTGIATVFGTQILPTYDDELMKLDAEFQRVLYGGLGGN
ncbi:hypothetical protein NLJ89_g7511 [Agrocybe chaxingu]|uniref:Beta-lactamase-related domain-containing protein n=1 Tax=Agrocybe chaxingu TaxID=84603 RepID=A0A9W8JW89_9AGAR|nr:hypothetical protein NLJ89_g7511 [Agrocybe chaxingu]